MKAGRARFRTTVFSGLSARDASRSGDASGDDGNSSDGNSSNASDELGASAADAARALYVSAVEQDALSSLSRAAREAVAGATACVCAGLDGDGDAALEVLRLVVVDALALDEARLRATRPLVTAPASAADLDRGVARARVAFVQPFSRRDERETATHETNETRDAAAETIDWSVVVAALVAKTASRGRYDARVSSCLWRLTRAAEIPWRPVAAFEDLLARNLRGALAETTRDEAARAARGAERRSPPPPRASAGAFGFGATRDVAKDTGFGRAAAVGAAAAVGGGLMFFTGGAAAPTVLASLTSLAAAGGALGAAATSAGSLVASFGGATGIAYALGGVGAGLTGWRAARRLGGLSQFAFLPLRGTDSGMRVFLYVPGFLRDPGDLFRSFGERDGVYSAVVEVPRRATSTSTRDAATASSSSPDEGAPRRARACATLVDVPSVGLALTDGTSTNGAARGSGGARVVSVVPGGVAYAAGVAEGSVIVSAVIVARDGDGRDFFVGEETPPDALGARAVAALFARAERFPDGEGDAPSAAAATRVELRLRRSPSRDADVDALARRRAGRDAEGEPPSSTARLQGEMDRAETTSSETTRRPSSRETSPLRNPRLAWPLPRGEQLVVAWERALLMDLGGAMRAFGRAAMTRYVGAQAVAHTSLASLASAVAWPVTLLNAGGFIDSPWALAEARSEDAGRALAEALLEGSARGAPRPVTVVAYSLGCDVVRSACARLLEAEAEAEAAAAGSETADAPNDASGAREAVREAVLDDDARDDAAADATTPRSGDEPGRSPGRSTNRGLGLIQDLVFVGAPLDTSFETWAPLRRVAAGRVVNAGDFGDLAPAGGGLLDAARGGDWMLRFLFRKKAWALRRGVAAWTRVDHPGVENVDVGAASGAHVDIPDRMGAILRVVGLDA